MSEILKAIRDAIKAGDESRYSIAKTTGISQSMLSRLMSGERGLSIEALEKLAKHLKLEIIIRPKRRTRKGN